MLKTTINFLGHTISDNGVKPNPDRVQSMSGFPQPKNPRGIKSFLGMANFYRRFIDHFADKAAPLTQLLKKDVKFQWNQECTKAFESLKTSLTQAPILQYPDFTKPFIITTDASKIAISAILSQGEIGTDLPVAYASRKLIDTETRYGSAELEVLAILFAVETYRPYVYNRKFISQSDHRALQWLLEIKSPSSRLMRWKIRLAGYDFEIKYIKGKANYVADCLSRYPPNTVENNDEAEENIIVNKTKNNSSEIKHTLIKNNNEAINANGIVDKKVPRKININNNKSAKNAVKKDNKNKRTQPEIMMLTRSKIIKLDNETNINKESNNKNKLNNKRKQPEIRMITRSKRIKLSETNNGNYKTATNANEITKNNKEKKLTGIQKPTFIESEDENLIQKYETELIITYLNNDIITTEKECNNLNIGEIYVNTSENKIYVA